MKNTKQGLLSSGFKKWVLALLIVLVASSFLPVASAKVEGSDTVTITEGNHEAIGLGELSDLDEVKLEVDELSGKLIDVYILSSSAYQNYKANRPFTTEFQEEQTSSLDDTWEVEGSNEYYLIIDNKDNGHTNDAVPDGSVTVKYSYEEEDINWWLLVACCGTCCGSIIVIAVIFIKRRNRKKDTRYHPNFQHQPSFPGAGPRGFQSHGQPRGPPNMNQQYPPPYNQQKPPYMNQHGSHGPSEGGYGQPYSPPSYALPSNQPNSWAPQGPPANRGPGPMPPFPVVLPQQAPGGQPPMSRPGPGTPTPPPQPQSKYSFGDSGQDRRPGEHGSGPRSTDRNSEPAYQTESTYQEPDSRVPVQHSPSRPNYIATLRESLQDEKKEESAENVLERDIEERINRPMSLANRISGDSLAQDTMVTAIDKEQVPVKEEDKKSSWPLPENVKAENWMSTSSEMETQTFPDGPGWGRKETEPTKSPAPESSPENPLAQYEKKLEGVWKDGYMNEGEFRDLKHLREEGNISLEDHRDLQEKVIGDRSLTPMRCPQCGKLGEYRVEERRYYCSNCQELL